MAATGTGRYVPGANALDNWLQNQRQAASLYGQAEQPLMEAINLFRPGGGYGAGQIAQIEQAGRQRTAESLADAVASGMSSGSLAAGVKQRVGSDVATQKLGVEDVRTNFLQQALAALSGLRGQRSNVLAQTYNPFETARMGVEASRYGSDMDALERFVANKAPQTSNFRLGSSFQTGTGFRW